MIKYQILENVVRNNIPSYDQLPKNKRKSLLRSFLYNNLETIAMKVKLPDPIQVKMDVMREQFWDQRRPKGHKRGEWKINYNLWRFLFEIKSKIKFNFLQNSEFELMPLQDITTAKIPKEEPLSSTSYFTKTYVDDGTKLKTNLKPIIHFKIDSRIEEKMSSSNVYDDFVRCLDNTCRSSTLKIKNANYYLHETKDLENPSWKKLILDIRYESIGFEEKLEKWDELRDKIDSDIDNLKNNSNLEMVSELEKKLFLNMIF